MAPKKTDLQQVLRNLRLQLIESRKENAELRRKLLEIEQAALTVIATFQQDSR